MEKVNRFLFGPTPTEKVRKWQTDIKREGRMLDREIRQLDVASNKVKAEVKKLALKGGKDDLKNCKILVREVVRSNKQRERLFTSQARLNSINMQLSHQLGQSLLHLLILCKGRSTLTQVS
jgi:charged multivesicular body protein 3